MSVVGNAPWMGNIHQRVQRAPVNELDKCTVVSILPKPIFEIKPTIQPGQFRIAPGSYDKPSVLVVGTSSWWKELDLDQPKLEIPVSSILVADSIVKDYCNGLLMCNMGDSMPGLFYVQGPLTAIEVRAKHKNLLDEALARQRKWYELLVKQADILWARTNGNPVAICEDARLAAQELQFKNKPWMKDFTTLE
jgi:hypothetical protein